jgi:4-hydroxyphenylpyruvate dioxygenase
MARRHWRVALHSWTLDGVPPRELLQIALRAGYDAVELRRVDSAEAAWGVERASLLAEIRASGIDVATVGIEPGLVFAMGAEAQRLRAGLREQCENAVALGCSTLMTSSGTNSGTLELARDNLRAAGEIAGEHGLRLAVELNFGHPVMNSLDVVRDVVQAAACPALGLMLDTFHLQLTGRGGRGFADIAVEEIAAFQYSDVPHYAAGEAVQPAVRLPPGQGCVDWAGVFGLLDELGYEGPVSYEAPHPSQRTRDPEAVAREGLRATLAVMA